MPSDTKPERILCAGCNKPILIDDFGGVEQIDGKQFWFHDNIVCLIQIQKIKQELADKKD